MKNALNNAAQLELTRLRKVPRYQVVVRGEVRANLLTFLKFLFLLEYINSWREIDRLRGLRPVYVATILYEILWWYDDKYFVCSICDGICTL